MIRDKFQSVKTHIQENKTVYVIGGVCFVVGVAGTVIFTHGSDIKQTIDAFKIQYKSPTINNIVTVIEREGRGHPGYRVRCIETGKTFLSQSQAAFDMGLDANKISRQLNGTMIHVDNFTFERLKEI